MDFEQLKYKVKSIPAIGNAYQFLIGNRKIAKAEREAKRNLRKIGKDLLQQIEVALPAYDRNLIYFSDYGTLLGIVRDHDFIEGDMDVDYGIIVPDIFSWDEFEAHLLKYDFYKVREYRFLGKIREQTYKYKNLSVDFFFKKNMGDYSYDYFFYEKKGYRYSSPYERHVREGKYAPITEVRKECFLGLQITIPVNAEEYLESVYTNNWRTPDPNWDCSNNSNVRPLEQLGIEWFIN